VVRLCQYFGKTVSVTASPLFKTVLLSMFSVQLYSLLTLSDSSVPDSQKRDFMTQDEVKKDVYIYVYKAKRENHTLIKINGRL